MTNVCFSFTFRLIHNQAMGTMIAKLSILTYAFFRWYQTSELAADPIRDRRRGKIPRWDP